MAIFSAIGTAIAGALFAGSTLAATLISGGLAFATSIGAQYLNRPKKRKYSAVQGEVQFGGDISVGTLLGIGKTKGQRSFYAKWDKGNKRNADVFILANGWCDGLEPYVYLFGGKKDLVAKPKRGGEAARYFVEDFIDGDGNGVIELRFYDGRPGQTVDQRLVDVTENLGRKWKTTSVNAGLCYVIVERYYSDKYFGSKGKPDIDFVLRGLREYDPRKDSTVAGGSGSQRLANPATYVHTTNPAVHRLNYQLGLRALISGRTLIGEGKTLGQLDLGTYFVAMNVCDALRTDGKKRFQCSLFVTGEDDHTEVLKEFDDAMAGYAVNRRGLSGIIPGAPQVPVLEVTAEDIPVDRAKDIQFRKSAFDRYNHMSGQFISIAGQWNPESLTPVYVNADIAADGRNRQTSNDFLQVTDPDIAQYLLNIRYRQNRKGGTATLPVSRRVGLRVQEGEWITWRGRTWMISDWEADEAFRITLSLSETGADIYDDEDIEPGPIVIPPTTPVNPSLLSTVQNFSVRVGLISGASGFQVPALEFTWEPPEDPTIVAVRFEYLIDGTTELLKDQSADPESGLDRTTKNIVSGVVYLARATITTVPDRLKTYTPWVSTGDPTGSLTSPYDGVVGFEKLGDDLKSFQEWIGTGYRDVLLTLDEISALIADQELGNATIAQSLREQVTATQADITASYMRDVKVLVTATAAIATRVEEVSTAFGSFQSSVTSQITSISQSNSALALSVSTLQSKVDDPITGNTANAVAVNSLTTRVTTAEGKANAASDAVNVLTASVGKFSASGKFRTTVEATPSGALARIGLSVAATDGDATSTAAMYMDALAGGLSRVLFEASQFIVVAGGNLNNPFVVDGAAVRMNVANIGTVNAGIIQSSNGKMVINVGAGTIVISS